MTPKNADAKVHLDLEFEPDENFFLTPADRTCRHRCMQIAAVREVSLASKRYADVYPVGRVRETFHDDGGITGLVEVRMEDEMEPVEGHSTYFVAVEVAAGDNAALAASLHRFTEDAYDALFELMGVQRQDLWLVVDEHRPTFSMAIRGPLGEHLVGDGVPRDLPSLLAIIVGYPDSVANAFAMQAARQDSPASGPTSPFFSPPIRTSV